jgi:hypothetical protein
MCGRARSPLRVDSLEIDQVMRKPGSVNTIQSTVNELRAHALGAAQVDHHRAPKTKLSFGDPRQLSLENLGAHTGVDELDESSYRNRNNRDAADQ